MGRLFTSLILTLTAFIVNDQPSAIAPRDYQQMLKKGINVDWWGRSEKNKYGAYSETAVKKFVQQGIKHVRFRLHHYHFTDEDYLRISDGGGRKSGLGAALSFVARFIDGVE